MEIPSFFTLEQHLHFLCRQGVEKGVFPGVAAGVLTGHPKGGAKEVATYGQTRLDELGEKVQPTTYFDLASLTKPLATTLSVFSLVESGIIGLHDRYADLSGRQLPRDKSNITVAHLLSHSSGLSPYKPYFKQFRPCVSHNNKEKLIQCILRDPLAYEIESDCRYSDLGFILLGDLIEKISEQSLDTLFRTRISAPLGLESDIFYVPLSEEGKIYKRNKFAATERCGWRNRIIQGEVHDEHCFLSGGVAGHAGLFGTIDGVLSLCGILLQTWQGIKTAFPLSKTTLDKIFTPQYPGRTWCLGFDTPSAGCSSGGTYISKRSVGHLGYCGTSFWIDPENDCVMVLLTNRVHPSRTNRQIREFRPWFHDRLMEFINNVGKE